MNDEARSRAETGVELSAQLRSTVVRLYRRLRSQRPEGSLGDTAVEVLTRIHKHGPLSLTDLSVFDRVSPASMSQTVNRLTSAGYAVRTTDATDRRKVLFRATPEGAEIVDAARAHRHAWLDERLGTLSAADQQTMARALELLQAMADE